MPKNRKRYRKTNSDSNYGCYQSEPNSANAADQYSESEDCDVDLDSNLKVVKKKHKAGIENTNQQESEEQENITRTFPEKAICLKIRDAVETAFESFQYGALKKSNYGLHSHKIFTAKKMINKTPYLKNIILIQPDENLSDEEKLEQGKKIFECIAQFIALTKTKKFSRKQTDCMILNDKTAAFEEKNQVKNRKQEFIANFLPPDISIGTVGVRSQPMKLLREKLESYFPQDDLEKSCNNPNNNNVTEDNINEEILKLFSGDHLRKESENNMDESDNDSVVTTHTDNESDEEIEKSIGEENNEAFSNVSNSQINNNINNINELPNNEVEISIGEKIEKNINHKKNESSVSDLLNKITFFKKGRESLKDSRLQLKANIVELENKNLKYQRKIEKQLHEEEQKFLKEQKKLEEAKKMLESKNEEVKTLKQTWKSLQNN